MAVDEIPTSLDDRLLPRYVLLAVGRQVEVLVVDLRLEVLVGDELFVFEDR